MSPTEVKLADVSLGRLLQSLVLLSATDLPFWNISVDGHLKQYCMGRMGFSQCVQILLFAFLFD